MLPIQSSLRALANPEKAKLLSGFFKTGAGQYGEGDIFLGIQVPETRKIVREYLSQMNLDDIEKLLQSSYHEERLAGVLGLVELSRKGRYSVKELGEFYIEHISRINNWDLVDLSAPQIIGPYLEECFTHEERVRFIEDCIQSPHLWTNRIIVIASFYQIRKGNEKLTFSIVPRFLSHSHDLMHKACGWMLREVGKRVSEERLCEFLDIYRSKMPRTMLRYAIERLSIEQKAEYMRK